MYNKLPIIQKNNKYHNKKKMIQWHKELMSKNIQKMILRVIVNVRA